ncbi:MAG: hypothetical protein JWN48_3344 [Myxococcaceae bacterium]|nr:hypothetical protein [Myxococcaceae bacterium]
MPPEEAGGNASPSLAGPPTRVTALRVRLARDLLLTCMGDASDWQNAASQLHFYPQAFLLVWVVDGMVVQRAEAWGGASPQAGIDYGRMAPRRTTPGRYVIESHGPYITRTWPASRIPWGTPLQRATDPNDVLYATGQTKSPWGSVKTKTGWARNDVKQTFLYLYGASGRRLYDPDGDGIPERWVFNDFGPIAVRYYVDKNRNQRRDRGERLSGEMIHTTPQDEAATARGQTPALSYSHGCVHVSPVDRDRFLALGAFEPGVDFIIHDDGESPPLSFQ